VPSAGASENGCRHSTVPAAAPVAAATAPQSWPRKALPPSTSSAASADSVQVSRTAMPRPGGAARSKVRWPIVTSITAIAPMPTWSTTSAAVQLCATRSSTSPAPAPATAAARTVATFAFMPACSRLATSAAAANAHSSHSVPFGEDQSSCGSPGHFISRM